METAPLLTGIGAILLVSLVADTLGRRTGLPRVSLLVLTGILAGPYGLDLIPESLENATELIAAMALTMVAFLLGGDLSRTKLAAQGRPILIISVTVALATFAAVAAGLALIGVPLPVALLLGTIATATDPAATRDVVREAGSGGAFTDRLLGIVAIDDAWGLILFGLAAAGALALAGNGTHWVLATMARDIGGSVGLGLLLGIPAAYMTGRIRPGEPLQSEALGIVLLCGGLALWLEVSYLLAAIVLGIVIANLGTHHTRSFREIQRIEWPFLVLFFVLAGAKLDLAAVWLSGAAGALFIGMRIVGRIAGGWIGGRLGGAGRTQSAWIGVCLLPQAGVALGMALVAANIFPAQEETILAVAIGGTVFFEILGPILTRFALFRVSSRAAEVP